MYNKNDKLQYYLGFLMKFIGITITSYCVNTHIFCFIYCKSFRIHLQRLIYTFNNLFDVDIRKYIL